MTSPISTPSSVNESQSVGVLRLSRGKDARGRLITQLDPVALHLLRRHDMIPADTLRQIAETLDPREVKLRPRAVLIAPLLVLGCYAGFFGYFHFFSRWKGWDPVLTTFGVFYFVFPFACAYFGFRKARRARHERIRSVMLEYLRCPHCGYDIRGLPVDTLDGATVCPECGCAWKIDSSQTVGDPGHA